MAALGFREIQKSLRAVGLASGHRVLALVSLSALGEVRGGAEAVESALSAACQWLLVPTFTYQCLVWPLAGPPDNGLTYGNHQSENADAEIFRATTPVKFAPAHAALTEFAETIRHAKGAVRSAHPALSFVGLGVGAEAALATQTLADPLAPLGHLAEHDGDIVLLGVDHTANIALHYAERLAGRKQFVRWALTPKGTVACAGWPGCSVGFAAGAEPSQRLGASAPLGPTRVQRYPARALLAWAQETIHATPSALLCANPTCEQCGAVRKAHTPPA